MADIDIPVLIAGGSLVGLTSAALLGAQGVRSLVVERHRGTAIHPRAASFHQKTMEVFRSLGIQPKVEEAAAREFVQGGAIMACESLGGKELAYFQKSYNEGVEHLSPVPRIFLTQIGLEPILRDKVLADGGDVRFGTELVSFTQDADGVDAVIRPRNGQSAQTVHADYLIAADGAHSSIRESLGIPLAGRGTFAQCITIYFKADITPMMGDRNLSVIYVNHPDFLGFFRFTFDGDAGFLAVFSTHEPDGSRNTDVAADTSDATCLRYVRSALGVADDYPVTIETVQTWDASAGWAQRFSHRRVFLAGDSAHTMPPTGGFGGNTGVADAQNLAWKIAAVLSGRAGAGLLSTYDAERRPHAALTVEQAYARYVGRLDPSLPKDNMPDILDDAAIELGAVCDSAAIVAAGEDRPATHNPRSGSLLVGSRAPHVWLRQNGHEISTLDLGHGSFALLTGGDDQDWCGAAAAVSERIGVPITAARVGTGSGIIDETGTFGSIYGMGDSDAVLVRPDGMVAWRSCDAPSTGATPADILTRVLARVLAQASDGQNRDDVIPAGQAQ